jgi:SMODS-associating 2TM, beta-strand rich effector domain
MFKNLIYAIVPISAIAWIVLAIINGLDLSNASVFLGQVPKVISIDVGIFLIFAKWGWKIPWFQGWLVPFPNLNGTWMGYIFSEWTDPKTGKKIEPIPTMLTIK